MQHGLRRRFPARLRGFVMVCVAFGLFAEAGPAADMQIPKVSITSPVVGATIAGTVVVSGTASDNVSVSKVELQVDSNAYQLASGTTAWTFSLDTTAYANGSHTLRARVTDSSGNKAWASVAVTFNNVDLKVPTLVISTPPAGATIAGTFIVSGSASDNVSVSKVTLRVDSNAYQLASGTTSWTFSLNTTAYADGVHTLTVRATDSSGNRASASRSVTISNGSIGSKIYWGAYMEGTQTYSYLYGGSWGNAPWDSTTWNTFESHAGKKASIVHWGAAPPWTHDFNYWLSTFNLVQNRGELSLVGMLTGTVPLKDIASGKYDSSIRTWGQQAGAWGHPFFLLLDPEMNGTWAAYSPGKNGNTAADFINAWRHFHDVAVNAGARNITWVWCPNVDPSNLYTPYSQLYPGNAYVDWTGFNGFNRDGRSSFSWLFGASYNRLLQIAPTKPILISETASEELLGAKVSWITDAFSTQLPKYFPRIKAVVWFNWRMYQNSRWWAWEIESSSSAQAAFKTAIGSSYYLAGGGLGGLPLRTKISPP
jgi:Bacterial Ig domain/Glycosyl hydrolase family 26